jgi:hypothetical protein
MPDEESMEQSLSVGFREDTKSGVQNPSGGYSTYSAPKDKAQNIGGNPINLFYGFSNDIEFRANAALFERTINPVLARP